MNDNRVKFKEKVKELMSSHLKSIINFLTAMFIGTISVTIYFLLHTNNMIDKYWVFIPIFIIIFLNFIQKIIRRKYFENMELIVITLISSIFISLIINFPYINNFYNKFEDIIIQIFFFGLLFLICLCSKYDDSKINFKKNNKKDLFNLFYINTSKVHEIAMLLDNKIMKTVEMEQSSEEILKYDSTFNFTKDGLGGISHNQVKENNNKKSVFESFDVKTTKSIMLRKIYKVAKNAKENKKTELGKVVMFTNTTLNQQNTDDTVMILNILKDSEMKNVSNDDNIELNMSKMMDELLDDFTIDYTFEENSEKYIIRIPYKSKNYFENSYSHNDLQLGKLSIIGIYRGKINFAKIDSISSKFLELLSQSYKKEKEKGSTNGLLQSSSSEENIENPLSYFNFSHKRLDGEHHLIDLIAIIQEISFEESESNE
ncbi:hypothetical protein [Marinisporobacter balticus]|uniref:Uncharacterized protein n=1 Tax=Marinisporobacter balticus TaxID=2018667 RepID=A0A4R2L2H8_9FIRM|nr:hypothetical protein [Marinisporobacter balticus]TCO79417.1 hypothetical protein EV214_102136 [Marinisporobacter balticus]